MRVAAWLLIGIFVLAAMGGVPFAAGAYGYHGVNASGIPYAVTDAMLATALWSLAGCALIGLIVLRGVVEVVNQGSRR